jgi:hypothetical protein
MQENSIGEIDFFSYGKAKISWLFEIVNQVMYKEFFGYPVPTCNIVLTMLIIVFGLAT